MNTSPDGSPSPCPGRSQPSTSTSWSPRWWEHSCQRATTPVPSEGPTTSRRRPRSGVSHCPVSTGPVIAVRPSWS
ncbi:hypothetical protein [Ornithinimicrobium kibberense]|uniref:hypothetical protein n=1 Tax=Ornithinimicrobium kibberense TaxID=282060 RepID=UPI00361A3107